MMNTRTAVGLVALGTALLAASPALAGQDPKTCPMHAKHRAGHADPAAKHAGHEGHHAEVDRRGDRVMGFSHTSTKHRFRLTRDGGAIEVTVNDAGDAAELDAIRSHLRDVATAFAKGDFAMPEAIHGRVPPGAAVMAGRRDRIAYTFEELERGGRVRIVTSDAEARSAVHDFLRFQIDDHRTGDPTAVEN